MRAAIRSRGFDISYRVDGEGPPLLLLHGWSRWADDWWEAGYGEKLASDYRVISVDWIGHGESDKPHDPADYRESPIQRAQHRVGEGHQSAAGRTSREPTTCNK